MLQTDRNWLRSPIERVGSLSDAALPPPAAATDDDSLLVRALQERDEAAFESLLDRFYSPMLRLASAYVRSRDEAEEVVQDTWLAVLAGIDRFEGRSSLKTWIFRILVNRARTRARREARSVPLSALNPDATVPEAALPLWVDSTSGRGAPDEMLLAAELRGRIDAAIRSLPARQQEVISLRDVHGWTAAEVCELLEITDANQRILLHRARVRVRDALADYLRPPGRGDLFLPAPAN